MHRTTNRPTLLAAATACFVATSFFWLPRFALSQTSLAEVQAVQAAQGEMAGERQGNARAERNQPNKKAAQRPAAAKAEPADLAKAFAKRARSATLNITSVLKLVGLFFIVWLWICACDWVNRDSQTHDIGWQKWTPIVFFPFLIVAIAVLFMELNTVVRSAVLFVVFLATWIPYVLIHNKRVESHETVLTGPWWRYVFASAAGKLGMKISAERKAEHEKGAPVELLAMGAETANDDNANLLSARHSPGYLVVKDMIVEMVRRRSEKVMFDFTKEAVNVRHEIDGVWHPGEAQPRDAGDVMLAVMKTLANLNVKDRRNKQSGRFGAKYDGHTYLCAIASQGVATGERVVVTRLGEEQHFDDYEALGMREGVREQWSQIMEADQGLVILSTLPGGGLTTLTNTSIENTDRLMRDFVSIEDVHHREAEIQNLGVTTYDSVAGETPATILPKLIRTYPNVYICRDLVDVESASLLFNEVRDERLVVTTVRAREAADALLRLLKMKVSAKDLSSVVTGVLYQRLVRMLCSECKVSYTPPPEVLRKLGIPAGKVEHLYRPPKGEEIEKPCESCQGVGYRGRTGIFELLVINDAMREILIKQPKLELLKKAARAARQRSLQEEGILLVAKGTTSLQELQRVLKQ